MLFLSLLFKNIVCFNNTSLFGSKKSVVVKPIESNNKILLEFKDEEGYEKGRIYLKDIAYRELDDINLLTASTNSNYVHQEKDIDDKSKDKSQIFKIILYKEDAFMFEIFNSKCLSYNKIEENFVLRDCSFSDITQRFIMTSGAKGDPAEDREDVYMNNLNKPKERNLIDRTHEDFFVPHFFQNSGPTFLSMAPSSMSDYYKPRKFSNTVFKMNRDRNLASADELRGVNHVFY